MAGQEEDNPELTREEVEALGGEIHGDSPEELTREEVEAAGGTIVGDETPEQQLTHQPEQKSPTELLESGAAFAPPHMMPNEMILPETKAPPPVVGKWDAAKDAFLSTAVPFMDEGRGVAEKMRGGDYTEGRNKARQYTKEAFRQQPWTAWPSAVAGAGVSAIPELVMGGPLGAADMALKAKTLLWLYRALQVSGASEANLGGRGPMELNKAAGEMIGGLSGYKAGDALVRLPYTVVTSLAKSLGLNPAEVAHYVQGLKGNMGTAQNLAQKGVDTARKTVREDVPQAVLETLKRENPQDLARNYLQAASKAREDTLARGGAQADMGRVEAIDREIGKIYTPPRNIPSSPAIPPKLMPDNNVEQLLTQGRQMTPGTPAIPTTRIPSVTKPLTAEEAANKFAADKVTAGPAQRALPGTSAHSEAEATKEILDNYRAQLVARDPSLTGVFKLGQESKLALDQVDNYLRAHYVPKQAGDIVRLIDESIKKTGTVDPGLRDALRRIEEVTKVPILPELDKALTHQKVQRAMTGNLPPRGTFNPGAALYPRGLVRQALGAMGAEVPLARAGLKTARGVEWSRQNRATMPFSQIMDLMAKGSTLAGARNVGIFGGGIAGDEIDKMIYGPHKKYEDATP